MRALASLPQAHALTSTTFTLPPLDGSLTLPEILDWHLEHNPDHPLFLHSTNATDQVKISFKHAVHAIHRAASLLTDRLAAAPTAVEEAKPPLVAIFAASDYMTYVCTWLGLVRAGYGVILVSPRNSPAAVAHLLDKTGAQCALVSSEPGLRSVLEEALCLMEGGKKNWDSYVSEMPKHEDLFPSNYEENTPVLFPNRKFNPESIVFYLHSSGTTAFPKPVPRTHGDLLSLSYSFQVSSHDFCDAVLACHSVPPFHSLGVMSILMACFCGMNLAVFKPQTPAIPLSPDTVFQGAIDSRSDYMFCVPLFIELWARDPRKVEHMKTLRGLIYGGGPLARGVGDHLAEQAVHLYTNFGSSENGIQCPVLPPSPGKDWEYFTLLETLSPDFVPQGDGTYELVLKRCDTHSPIIINTTFNGLKACSTSDLLVPHPTKEGYWKVFGRTDDQIMLNTGEKTNPGPLENILCQDPRVQAAVMFGRGRFQNGVIIQPKPDFAFDPQDERKLSEFRTTIWSTVERMNTYAPQHSRLFKEMILVAQPNKPFTFTPKGTARRQSVLKDYDAEIDALYVAISETSQRDISGPQSWTSNDCHIFVRRAVESVLKSKVKDDDDVFQHGCDSLQATWIRNTIARALRDSPETANCTVPFDIIYAHPSISSLTDFLAGLASSNSEVPTHETKIQDMRALADKYSANFVKPGGIRERSPNEHVIAITGTTGGLGSNLLAKLIESNTVSKIFALNRKSLKGEPIADRQRIAMVDRGLDGDAVHSSKLSLLEVDFSQSDLALGDEVLAEMRDTVTCFIHNAWRVDFNLALSSFEPQLIGTRHLLDLALSSNLRLTPTFLITSSVGVLQNATAEKPVDEILISDPAVAVGAGYAESKWVAEQMVARASEIAPSMRTIVVRVGQLSGGVTGVWNTSEWLPSLVASGPVLGCLPDIDAHVAWIPLAAAASALVDIALAPASPSVMHVAHPHPVTWSTIFSQFSQMLGVSLVPYGQWLHELETSLLDTSKTEVEHMRANPALRLLAFYRAAGTRVGPGREAMGLPMMSTRRTQEVTATLRAVEPLGEADVDSWVKYWKRAGLLKSQMS